MCWSGCPRRRRKHGSNSVTGDQKTLSCRFTTRSSEMSTRHGGQVLIDQLRIHGADTAFCVPGESYLAALDGLADTPENQTVVCRQEGGAAMMADAEGEAARFEALLTEYQKAPQVTRQRLYLEAVEDVYGANSKVVITRKN